MDGLDDDLEVGKSSVLVLCSGCLHMCLLLIGSILQMAIEMVVGVGQELVVQSSESLVVQNYSRNEIGDGERDIEKHENLDVVRGYFFVVGLVEFGMMSEYMNDLSSLDCFERRAVEILWWLESQYLQ